MIRPKPRARMNGKAANKQSVKWLLDKKYQTQVSYPLETPCLLEVAPEFGPDSDVPPGKELTSIRCFELFRDGTDRERRGLAQRRMDPGHLAPFLKQLRAELLQQDYLPAPEHLVITSGRVRAGYRIGEVLFGDLPGSRTILHVIGERPGTGHHTFSIYITSATGKTWGEPNKVDHNITKVVSGVATTAVLPRDAAIDTVRLLKQQK